MNFFKHNSFSKGGLVLMAGILSGFSLLACVAILLLKDLVAAETTLVVALFSTAISLFLLTTETRSKKTCSPSKQE